MEITRRKYFAAVLNYELLHMRITLAYEASCYVPDLFIIFILDELPVFEKSFLLSPTNNILYVCQSSHNRYVNNNLLCCQCSVYKVHVSLRPRPPNIIWVCKSPAIILYSGVLIT